jgi:hypothetical protein
MDNLALEYPLAQLEELDQIPLPGCNNLKNDGIGAVDEIVPV